MRSTAHGAAGRRAVEDHGRRAGRGERRGVLRVGQERDVAGTRLLDAGHARHLDRAVALEHGAEAFRELCQRHEIEPITRPERPAARRTSPGAAGRAARPRRARALALGRGEDQRGAQFGDHRARRHLPRHALEALRGAAPGQQVADGGEREEVAEDVRPGDENQRHRDQQPDGVDQEPAQMTVGVALEAALEDRQRLVGRQVVGRFERGRGPPSAGATAAAARRPARRSSASPCAAPAASTPAGARTPDSCRRCRSASASRSMSRRRMRSRPNQLGLGRRRRRPRGRRAPRSTARTRRRRSGSGTPASLTGGTRGRGARLRPTGPAASPAWATRRGERVRLSGTAGLPARTQAPVMNAAEALIASAMR